MAVVQKEFMVTAVKDMGTSEDAPHGKVSGYAATFGGPDRDGDCINSGAFGTGNFSVPLLAFHDRARPIGKAVCTPTPLGLWTEATFIDTKDAQDMRKAMAGGAVPAFSFMGSSKTYDPNEYGGVNYNHLDVMEVSGVTIPANPKALVATIKSYQGSDIVEGVQQERQATKRYADVEAPEGSFEKVQDELRDAVRSAFGGQNIWVSLLATFPDSVVYTVENDMEGPGSIDGAYQVAYVRTEDGEITLGAPKPVEVEQTIVPASKEAEAGEVEKSCIRNAAKDQKALNNAHDAIITAGADCPAPEKSFTPTTLAATTIKENTISADTITSGTIAPNSAINGSISIAPSTNGTYVPNGFYIPITQGTGTSTTLENVLTPKEATTEDGKPTDEQIDQTLDIERLALMAELAELELQEA